MPRRPYEQFHKEKEVAKREDVSLDEVLYRGIIEYIPFPNIQLARRVGDIKSIYAIRKELGYLIKAASESQKGGLKWNYFKWWYTVDGNETRTLIRSLKVFGLVDSLKEIGQSPVGSVGIAIRSDKAVLDEAKGKYTSPLTMGIKRVCDIDYSNGVVVSTLVRNVEDVRTGKVPGALWESVLMLNCEGEVDEYTNSSTKGDYSQSVLAQLHAPTQWYDTTNKLLLKVIEETYVEGIVLRVHDSSKYIDVARDIAPDGVSVVEHWEDEHNAVIQLRGTLDDHRLRASSGKGVITITTGTNYLKELGADEVDTYQIVSIKGEARIAITSNLLKKPHTVG